jgi:hypothetical protein
MAKSMMIHSSLPRRDQGHMLHALSHSWLCKSEKGAMSDLAFGFLYLKNLDATSDNSKG